MALAVEEQLIEQSMGLLTSLLPDAANFPGLTVAQVWDEIAADINPELWPAVLFTTNGVKEDYEAIDEDFDHVTRRVVCAIVQRTDPRYTGPRPDFLLWRQSLIRVFSKQSLRDLVQGVVRTWIDTEVIINEASVPKQYYVSGFVLRNLVVEPRGILGQNPVT